MELTDNKHVNKWETPRVQVPQKTRPMVFWGRLHLRAARESRAASPVCVCVCACSHSVMSDSVTPWTIALPDSSVHVILQARILEWVAIPFSRGGLPSQLSW